MLVRHLHHQRTERAHFLMEQSNGIVLSIIGAEAVGADHLGKPVGFVRRSHIPAAAHFTEADFEPRFGELPRSFGSGEAAADDVDVEAT